MSTYILLEILYNYRLLLRSTIVYSKGNGQNLPLLQGARHISEPGIAAPASYRSYCILKYSRTNFRPLFSTTEQRTAPEY